VPQNFREEPMGDRLRLLVALFLMSLLSFAFFLDTARAGNRVALVIGNSAYQKVPALHTSANDAEDIARSFERLGFSVSRVTDARFDDFRRGLLEFGRVAREAEMAVVYYSGHGLAIGGENWLVPVDAELRSDIDVNGETVGLRSLMLAVSGAKDLGLVILDACRPNPFLSTMQHSIRTRSLDRGFARVEPADNVLVAFAAKDGTVAIDDTGLHSPFTDALLANLEAPGLELNFLLRNVRDDVLKATNGQQQPFFYGSLSKQEIYLKAPLSETSSGFPKAPPADEVAWNFLRNTSDVATLRRFLERFPSSPYRPEVKFRIASLEQAALQIDASKPVLPVTLVPSSTGPNVLQSKADEDIARRFVKDTPDIEIAWDILKDTSDTTVIRRFVNQFPAKQRTERVANLDRGARDFVTAAVGDCDRFAADSRDPARPGGTTGVDFGLIEFRHAVAVCRQAVLDFPNEARLKYELCRALMKAGNVAEGTEMCREAAAAAQGPVCVAASFYGDFLRNLKPKSDAADNKKSEDKRSEDSKKKKKVANHADDGPPPPDVLVRPQPMPVMVMPMPGIGIHFGGGGFRGGMGEGRPPPRGGMGGGPVGGVSRGPMTIGGNYGKGGR
jgi:Caspase domain